MAKRLSDDFIHQQVNLLLPKAHSVKTNKDEMINARTGLFVKEKARTYGCHPVMVFFNLLGSITIYLYSYFIK